MVNEIDAKFPITGTDPRAKKLKEECDMIYKETMTRCKKYKGSIIIENELSCHIS